MSLQKDLLSQARQLATRERKKPKQASLRRAISAAYYALFHLLVAEATARLVTGGDRAALRATLGRAFAHGNMNEAAKSFAKNPASGKVALSLGKLKLQADLISVATAFVELQQARHEADYDTGRRFTRQECLDLVKQAEQSFVDWQKVRQTLQADTFLVALLAQRHMRS